MNSTETEDANNSVIEGELTCWNLSQSIQPLSHNIQDSNKRKVYTEGLHDGVTRYDPSAVHSNGSYVFRVAPGWALSNNCTSWNYEREFIARNNVQTVRDLYFGQGSHCGVIGCGITHTGNFTNLLQSNFESVIIDPTTLGQLHERRNIFQQENKTKEKLYLFDANNRKDSVWDNYYKFLSKSCPFACCTNQNIECSTRRTKYSNAAQNTTWYETLSKISERDKNFCAVRLDPVLKEEDKASHVLLKPKETDRDCDKHKQREKRHYAYLESSSNAKRTCSVNHFAPIQADIYYKYANSSLAKCKEFDYNSIGKSNDSSCNSECNEALLDKLEHNESTNIKKNIDCVMNTNLKQETSLSITEYLKDRALYVRYNKKPEKASSGLNLCLNDSYGNFKRESYKEEKPNKTEKIEAISAFRPSLKTWGITEMSGQYPGHSRPPVGTPPPQTVWNHLTMTQGQVSGLNIHPTALSGTALNSAGFYTHPSMARASHLTSQLTPQLAHTQAPPTWHTPTVPSKTPANTPGNPLFSLQMLVDNRQNQSQYRNSPGSQSTLDLSATSDIIPENYSRIPQDIPISLTARNVDKGSRNGNIISPPIPLNGETSSDSGISSSVPTPNSVGEPVSLSTKEITTPKITVKNFESNLKGVANIHDKIKEISIDNFTQKVINLPPSVTIERVVADKKETEVTKSKDTLSVIAQVPRNVLPVIVNLTSKMEKDVTDSPKRESSSERDKKIEETSVRSPKNLPKRGKKGVDSLLEKLEGGNKKLGTENIGSVIVMPVEERDTSSVKSMSPERQKSKSPNREDEVVSPAFSNDDSNDNTKQRRKRKLEKPVRLSKDSKTEVEDMELEPTEPTEPRTREPLPDETVNSTQAAVKMEEQIDRMEQRLDEKANENSEERNEENQPVRRRRSSEGPTTNSTSANQRVRRKSSDDAIEFSKVTSPKGVNNTNPFNEVESELEKMFAGIVETETDIKKVESKAEFAMDEVQNESANKLENIENNILQVNDSQNTDPTDVSSTVDAKLTGKKGKKGKVQSGKRKFCRSSENIFGSVSGEPSQKDVKKKRTSKSAKKQELSKKVKKNVKVDGYREIAYDSGSNASSIRSRGPVVHVEGPRDSPLSIQVVNAPREEEEEKNKEKRKSIGNGNAGRSKRLSHQNDLDYRGKVSRAGLFSSTLSSRYDAHTTDSTWVCVFCKQGPHSIVPGDPSRPHPNLAGPHITPGTYTVPAGVLSDLFGPYLIGKERLEDGILSADEQEITTEQKKGGKNKRSLRYAGLADQFSAKMSRKKRNSVESNSNIIFTGMTVLPGEEQRWEVWLHEQCAIWAAGVYMAGGRVTGLQEAVWDAAKSVCDSCGLTGANIGCVKRGCKAVTHYPCALTKGWHLDTNQYIPKCNLHRVT